MNKQAFAFLTLFTLILMLSIYYVTLPADQGQLNPDQILTGQNDPDNSLETMQQQLEDKHNAETQNSQSVLSSSGSSTEDKQNALQEVGKIEQKQQLEQKIVDTLSSAGYAGCLAEISDEVVRIACPKSLSGADTASKIMKAVAELVEDGVVPEVSFK